MFVTCYFLLVALYFLLAARYFLLVNCYFLLVARYFLLVACYFLLVARDFLPLPRCSLLFARCSLLFRPNYCEIKLLWTAKEWFDYNETPRQIFSLQISEILFFWMVVFKVFSTCKTISKVDIKSQILPELITLWCLYYNIWTRFYLILCTWRVRSSRPEEFYQKGALENSTNLQENICAGVSFPIKLQAGDL